MICGLDKSVMHVISHVIFVYVSVCLFLDRAKQASFFLSSPKEIYTLCSEQIIQCSSLFPAESLCFLLGNSFKGLDQSFTNRKGRLIVNTSPALMHFWFLPCPLSVKQTKYSHMFIPTLRPTIMTYPSNLYYKKATQFIR